jgi:hypothetical protein
MDHLTPGEETMISALARQVWDGDWAACGTLSPMPAAAARVFGKGGTIMAPAAPEGLARGRFVQGGTLRVNLGEQELSHV